VPAFILPIFSASLPADVRAALSRLAADWAAKKLDGKMTVQEFLAWMGKALDEGMVIVAPITSGATKKDAIMALAGYLFDVFSPFIIAKAGWLVWLLSFFGGGSLKDEFLQLVSFSIELFYNAKFKPAP